VHTSEARHSLLGRLGGLGRSPVLNTARWAPRLSVTNMTAHTCHVFISSAVKKAASASRVVARILSQYFIDRQLPFLGFDTDRSHGSLLRFYADYASPVIIDRFEGLDGIVEAAVAEPERRIIVDLAAQTHRFLSQWMTESGLLDADNDLGISLTTGT